MRLNYLGYVYGIASTYPKKRREKTVMEGYESDGTKVYIPKSGEKQEINAEGVRKSGVFGDDGTQIYITAEKNAVERK